MEKHNYKFVDRVFEITTQYSFFYLMNKDYISSECADCSFSIREEDISYWIDNHKENNFPREYIETLVALYKICNYLINDNVILFHGASFYIDKPDNGFIITAPSGVGKSTHACLLASKLKDRFIYINGDKPFLKEEDNKYYLYGSSFNGKERLSNNVKATLKAIFVLRRSNTCSISKLRPDEAISLLIQQVHIPLGEEATNIATDILISLVNSINIYLLSCDISKEASDTSFKVIKEYLQ